MALKADWLAQSVQPALSAGAIQLALHLDMPDNILPPLIFVLMCNPSQEVKCLTRLNREGRGPSAASISKAVIVALPSILVNSTLHSQNRDEYADQNG